jgi:hypothetical protein
MMPIGVIAPVSSSASQSSSVLPTWVLDTIEYCHRRHLQYSVYLPMDAIEVCGLDIVYHSVISE